MSPEESCSKVKNEIMLKIFSQSINLDMFFFLHDWWGKRFWAQSETWGLDIHTASQQGLLMRPRQQLCGELGSDLRGTVRSVRARACEEQRHRKRHKEGVGVRVWRWKQRKKDGRGGKRLCLGNFHRRNLAIPVPTLNVRDAAVCRLSIKTQKMT